MNTRDRKLGMDADITRRDFLNGVSVAIGASLLPTSVSANDSGAQDLAGYYPPREQYWHDLLATPFETFERNIRDQLGRILKDGGFDPARDIKAITVNRWPHGYAMGYDYESERLLWGGEFLNVPDEKKLWLTGRKRFGRIAFANTDAGAMAMTEAAVEQAYRATQELLGAT